MNRLDPYFHKGEVVEGFCTWKEESGPHHRDWLSVHDPSHKYIETDFLTNRRPTRPVHLSELRQRLNSAALRAEFQEEFEELRAEVANLRSRGASTSAVVEAKTIASIMWMTKELFHLPVDVEVPEDPDENCITFTVRADAAMVEQMTNLHGIWREKISESFLNSALSVSLFVAYE